MKKIKSYFEKSNKGAILIISLVLLCLYGFSVSSFLASVPSEGFSREVEVAKVTSGEQININSHIETIRLSDEETLITAVDNHEFKLITISRLGEIVNEKVIELDLYNAREISVDLDGNILTLYYVDEDLFQVTIDLDTLEYTSINIAKDVDELMRIEDVLIYQVDAGLFAIQTNDLTNPVQLVDGAIKSYTMDLDEETNTFHLMTTIRNVIAVDILYIQFDENLNVENEIMLEENAGNSYLKYISVIEANDNILTAVYVWSDNKYGENNVTVHQYNTQTGELITDYRHEFALHNSKYIITDVTSDRVTMLFQEDVHYGINITEVVMEEENEATITPLTKTKKLSYLSKYFEFGEDQALVFFDISQGDKIIYFASSNPELIETTTKATSIDPIRIIGLIFIVIFQSAFISGIYFLLFVAIGPFVLLLVLNRFLPDFKNKIYIQSGISTIIHTILKIRLTYQLINVLGTYVFIPPFVGEEPYIYIFVAFLSMISYYLMTRYIKWNIEYKSTPAQGYLNFIFFDYVSYTLIVYIYITTYLVINKI